MKAKKTKLKIFFLVIVMLFLTAFLSLLTFFTIAYNKYDLDKSKLTDVNNGIKVYSATGNNSTLYNTNRSIVKLADLPSYVPKAFIDTEDKKFYSHHGYDTKRIVKAALVNLTTNSKSQGASTISQQLIKNTLLNNEKTYKRKLQELILSIKMEKEFTKDEILEMYLNTIYFGSNAYGIENASITYFGKSAKDLTQNEACCLAGIIKSPNYYSPKNNLEKSVERKNLIAKLMLENNDLAENEYNSIINQSIETISQSNLDTSYEQEAIYEACSLLNMTERELINCEYEIITYKDDDLQKEVEEINSNNIANAKSKTNSELDSLSVVISNDGKVLSYYANSNYNLHNLKRQPASTFKPFAVYIPCIIHNILSPSTPILDEEVNYNGFNPSNADKKYHGFVTAKTALAQSLNIPSVKFLDEVGIKKSKEVLTSLGFNLKNADLNLNLALGSLSNGVNLMNLLNSYSTLANLGTYRPITFIDKILDKNKNVIYENENYSNECFKKEDCFLLNSMLKETATTGTAKRLDELNLPICSKTGTAYNGTNNTDLYNFAYTTEHSIMTWISNIKDNHLPNDLHSSTEPTQINKEILSKIYKNHKPDDFVCPENIIYTGYDLIEFENNHRIVAPTSNLDRYIAYDYFKLENKPEEIVANNSIKPLTELTQSGLKISFNAKENITYNIYKTTTSKTNFKTITNTTGNIDIFDYNIFNYEEIKYEFYDDKNNKLCEDIIIKPKEFLINYFNNQMLTGKHKWAV